MKLSLLLLVLASLFTASCSSTGQSRETSAPQAKPGRGLAEPSRRPALDASIPATSTGGQLATVRPPSEPAVDAPAGQAVSSGADADGRTHAHELPYEPSVVELRGLLRDRSIVIPKGEPGGQLDRETIGKFLFCSCLTKWWLELMTRFRKSIRRSSRTLRSCRFAFCDILRRAIYS
jgi:hypothetical protein